MSDYRRMKRIQKQISDTASADPTTSSTRPIHNCDHPAKRLAPPISDTVLQDNEPAIFFSTNCNPRMKIRVVELRQPPPIFVQTDTSSFSRIVQELTGFLTIPAAGHASRSQHYLSSSSSSPSDSSASCSRPVRSRVPGKIFRVFPGENSNVDHDYSGYLSKIFVGTEGETSVDTKICVQEKKESSGGNAKGISSKILGNSIKKACIKDGLSGFNLDALFGDDICKTSLGMRDNSEYLEGKIAVTISDSDRICGKKNVGEIKGHSGGISGNCFISGGNSSRASGGEGVMSTAIDDPILTSSASVQAPFIHDHDQHGRHPLQLAIPMVPAGDGTPSGAPLIESYGANYGDGQQQQMVMEDAEDLQLLLQMDCGHVDSFLSSTMSSLDFTSAHEQGSAFALSELHHLVATAFYN